MKKISQIIMVLMFIAGGAFSALAQSDKDKIIAEIMRLEADYIEASKNLRAEDFERFYAPDFMVTARIPPKILTNEQRLKTLKDPNFKRGTVESLTNDDLKVRLYGDDTAIVTAHWKRVSRGPDGKDTSASGRFTHVWVKQNGKWLLAAAHYSPDIDLEKIKASQSDSKKNR